MELKDKYIIKEKVVIKEKDENYYIPKENLIATLSWTYPIDLDLYGIYRLKNGREGTIYYHNLGSLETSPYISLDKDEGVGDVGGDNEENMRFKDLSQIQHLLIVANIYKKKNVNFAQYDGKVVVSASNGQGFEVPLTEQETGSWCVVARVENTDLIGPKLFNVNKVFKNRPKIDYFTGELTGNNGEVKTIPNPPPVVKQKSFINKVLDIFR